MIEDVIATVLRHTGQRLAGWLSPALSNTERTIGLLAEHGVRYVCDLFHDDQPFPVNVPRGRLISLPYALETNDGSVYGRRLASPREYGDIIRAQFDQLYLEGAESGRVMCIPLHPFQSGRPHRVDPLDRALAHIKAHSGRLARHRQRRSPTGTTPPTTRASSRTSPRGASAGERESRS